MFTCLSNIKLNQKTRFLFTIFVYSLFVFVFVFVFVQSAAADGPLGHKVASDVSAGINLQKNVTATAKRVRISRKDKGIDADLVKGDAYYIRKDGKRVQYLRKRGVHIVNRSDKSLATGRLVDKFSKEGKIEKVDQHQLGKRSMIRVLQNKDVGVKSLINNSQPVFANANGEGDIEVLPFFTVKLKSNIKLKRALKTLSKQFNLRVIRKLKVSGNVFSLAMGQTMSDPDQAFHLVRALNNSPIVDWAEPQFNAKPIKHAVTNDSLFSDQWHLHNTTQKGALCDADCDATLAWNTHKGSGTVIAIIDDGVQLDHPDLQSNIWTNSAEIPNNDIDDDLNGYVDDVRGYDFVADSDAQGSSCFDGTVGHDADPSPQTPAACLNTDGESVVEDDHGTAVAGIAAAVGDNGEGVAGVAYQSKILPIRIISGYDTGFLTQGTDFCTRVAEAMTYAGRYADVVNNSWEMITNCAALESAIDHVVAGTIMDGGVNVSKRPNKGSPVIFSAGNSAAGWYKVTVDGISAGSHEFEWRFTRSPFADPFQTVEDIVWIDDIQWPDNSVEGFEGTGFDAFNTGCDINQCTLVPGACALDTSSCDSIWELNNDPTRSRGGSGRSLKADLSSDADTVCDYTYLTTKRTVSAGSMSFWIWASADFSFDKVEFLIDGQEKSSFGDLPRFVQNEVSYPANLTNTIAVGASTDGVFMDANNATANLSKEERAYYSQYGSDLDLVAPSSNQHQGITSTDRTGVNGFNVTDNLNCLPLSDCDYTNSFGGTSAAAPMVSGAAAILLEANPSLTAAQVRTHLQNGSDQIGPYVYSGGTSDETGHGRLNVFQSLKLAQGLSMSSPTELCAFPELYVTDPVYSVLDKKDHVFNACISQVYVDDTFCFPIKAKNGNVAMICL